MYAVVSSCVCSLDSIKKLKATIQPDTWADCARLCTRVDVFSNLLTELKNFPHMLNDIEPEEQVLLADLEKLLIAVEAYVTDFVTRTSFKGITEASFRNGSSTDFGKLNQQIVKFAVDLGKNTTTNGSGLFDQMRQEDLEDQRKAFNFAFQCVLKEISATNDLYIDQSFEMLRQDVEQYSNQIIKFLAANKHMGLTVNETKALKADTEGMLKVIDESVAQRLKACVSGVYSDHTSNDSLSKASSRNSSSTGDNNSNSNSNNNNNNQNYNYGGVQQAPIILNSDLLGKLVRGDRLSNDEKFETNKLLGDLKLSNDEVAVSRYRIGQGGFGDVYLGTFRRKYKVAIKSLRNMDDPYAEAKKKSIENELLLMKFLGSYPTILSCYGYTMQDDSLQIVLELAPFGSLDHMLRDKNSFKSFPMNLSVAWLCDLADAIKFLHSKGIKHRDIKAENMLVFERFHIKLCDFGPAKQHIANVTAESKVGTFVFMAPEIRVGQVSEFASDIFSFGMTAIQIISRKTPKIDDFANQIRETMEKNPIDNLAANEKLHQLLVGSIQYDPTINVNLLRPSAEVVSFQMIEILELMGGDIRDDEDHMKEFEAIARKKEADRFKHSMSKSGSSMFRPQSGLSRKNSPTNQLMMGFGSSNESMPKGLGSSDEISIYSSNPNSPMAGRNAVPPNSASSFFRSNNNLTNNNVSMYATAAGSFTSRDDEDKNNLARYFNISSGIALPQAVQLADMLIKNGVANTEVLRRRLTRNTEFLLDLGIEETINDQVYDDLMVRNGKANVSSSSSAASAMSPRSVATTARRRNAMSPIHYEMLPTEVSRLYYDAAQLNKTEAYDKLLELIEKGDRLAECFVMRMNAIGQGFVKKDLAKAKEMGKYLLPWLKDMVEMPQADLSALYIRYLIGVCYAEGLGTSQDQREAVRWCKLSAEQGYAAAQAYIGFCSFSGVGVPKNLEEAVRWYRMAADQGYAPAQCNLGLCYENGYGVAKNVEQAVRWYRLAADQGDAAALYNLGYCYEKGCGVAENLKEAVRFYKCSAGYNYTAAQYNLGVCYYFGTGVEQNMIEAVNWYRLAADKGYAPAQCNLGLCYENGHGVEQDYVEATYWYRQASDQGNAAAMYYLGFLHFSGMGVEKDIDEAVRLYKLSAEKNYSPALNNLGFCYFNGLGVPKNYTHAVKYYRIAAEQGYAPAQYNMGYCYEKGYGVVMKTQSVIRWYRLAAENGNEKAKKALARFQVY